MITLISEIEVEIYISVSEQVCIKHEDLQFGKDSILCMTKARAIELSRAVAKVAKEAD